MVDALLAAKAKADVPNRFNDTPLMAAALQGHLDVARRLLAAGAALDPPGWTPLIYAATAASCRSCAILLDQGANVDAVSPNGTTALMMAVREHRIDVADLLLARGADVNGATTPA
jgi:ankyrin repeat protein